MTPQELDEVLGRLARSRAARVLGWSLVGLWCAYVAVRLLA